MEKISKSQTMKDLMHPARVGIYLGSSKEPQGVGNQECHGENVPTFQSS